MTKYCLAVVVAMTMSGCAANVEVRYPAPTGSVQHGSLLVRFSEPMRAVSVSIDGLLVAEGKHTERVHVIDVPTGSREVSVVAAAGDRTSAVERSEVLNVARDQEVSMLVPVPPRSLGHWISSAAFILSYTAIVIVGDWWRQ